MRLITFVNWCAPNWGSWLGTVAELVVIVFVIEIIVPANAYLKVQAATELITLHVSDWYRVVGLLVGAGLIATLALLPLLETTTLRGFISGLYRYADCFSNCGCDDSLAVHRLPAELA
jgi:TRAP-type C4-dicarboxylate transport system permease small subunit